MKYTVFFDQVNRTNFQVEADSEQKAEGKAKKLYHQYLDTPSVDVQEGWLMEFEGEDK